MKNCKILYVFPHPDDESFGFGPTIAKQVREAHQVHLLTLTRGEATRERKRLGLSKEEMGEQRVREMRCVKSVLGLRSLEILSYPDSDLDCLESGELEGAILLRMHLQNPDVVVTYASHGISGFKDHIICHEAAKRAFVEFSQRRTNKRLAFCTMSEQNLRAAFQDRKPYHDLKTSDDREIDCVVVPEESDIEAGQRSLDCYESYQEVVEKTGVRRIIEQPAAFELFQESYSPPLSCLSEALEDLPSMNARSSKGPEHLS